MTRKSVSLITFALLLTASLAISADYDLRFAIDRTNVPTLYFKDLTLKINSCGATGASVKVDGKAVPSSVANGNVVFSTSGTNVIVSLAGATSTSGMGQFSKAALKNDKKWAWSHSIDDNYNTNMDADVAVFKSFGYAGTLYLNAYAFSFLTSPVAHFKNDGWAIGNHTYHHETAGTPFSDDSEVTENDKAIYQQLANIGITDYTVTTFANPFFDGKWNTVVHNLYTAGKTNIVLQETGSDPHEFIVDSGAATFSGWQPVSYSLPVVIGRDNTVYGGVKAGADFMHTNANATRHFWYNSYCDEPDDASGATATSVVGYVHTNYDTEAWVTSCAEIYSYLLVRQKSLVTYAGSSQDTSGLAVAGVVSQPDSICNDKSNSVTVTAQVTIVKGSIASVTADLTSLGGSAAVTMTHSSGNTYSCALAVPAAFAPGIKTYTVSAAANSGALRTATGTLKIGVGALRTLDIYTDNTPLHTAIGWSGDGGANTSKATEISTGAYEGTKCTDFAYTVGGYWAGFGFNFGSSTLDATGYDTLVLAHKGPDGSLNCSVALKSATGSPVIGTFQSSTTWQVVKMPIPSGTPLSAIEEVNFNVSNAQTSPAGHMYIDAVQLIGHGVATALSPNRRILNDSHAVSFAAGMVNHSLIAVQTQSLGRVGIFDLSGNRVFSTLVPSAPASLQFHATHAGTYLVRFEGKEASETRKIIVR